MRRGLYRVRGANGAPGDIRVDDDGIEVPVTEELYQSRGYLPRMSELPWQEEYLAAKTGNRNEGAGAVEARAKAERERARREFQMGVTQNRKF